MVPTTYSGFICIDNGFAMVDIGYSLVTSGERL
jgi:hypothetical protein